MTADQMMIDFEEYCEIPRMNGSTLVKGFKSMRALYRAVTGRVRPPTPAMQFGNKYHTMILEPDLFEATYVVMPNYAMMPENVTGKGGQSTSWATVFCKESKAAFEAAADEKGQHVITRAEYDRGLAMCESLMSDHYAADWVKNCKKEVTLLGEIDGVPFKGRVDLLSDSIIVDLKGTNDASEYAFGRSAANLRYCFKLAIYRELFRQNFGHMPEVFLLAVETDGDFDCCVYEPPEPALEEGWKQVKRLVGEYLNCKRTGEWPGVSRGKIQPLHIPNWAMPDDGLEWS